MSLVAPHAYPLRTSSTLSTMTPVRNAPTIQTLHTLTLCARLADTLENAHDLPDAVDDGLIVLTRVLSAFLTLAQHAGAAYPPLPPFPLTEWPTTARPFPPTAPSDLLALYRLAQAALHTTDLSWPSAYWHGIAYFALWLSLHWNPAACDPTWPVVSWSPWHAWACGILGHQWHTMDHEIPYCLYCDAQASPLITTDHDVVILASTTTDPAMLSSGSWSATWYSHAHPDTPVVYTGSDSLTTTLRLLLQGAVTLLPLLPVDDPVIFWVPSQSLLKPLTTGRLAEWAQHAWLTQRQQPVRHADLWQHLTVLLATHPLVAWEFHGPQHSAFMAQAMQAITQRLQ